jgi:hypothetical protein
MSIQRYGIFINETNKCLYNMTKEELEGSRLFQIMERLLKREYPFIKGLQMARDFANYARVLFLVAYVDLDELAEMYEFTFPSWRKDDMSILYLSHFPLKASFELKKRLTDLENEIEALVNSVSTNHHIPLEYREIVRRSEGEDKPYNFKVFSVSKFIPVAQSI